MIQGVILGETSLTLAAAAFPATTAADKAQIKTENFILKVWSWFQKLVLIEKNQVSAVYVMYSFLVYMDMGS